jgi:AcrR family transcriptional regulator
MEIMKHQSLVSFPEQTPGLTRRAIAKQRTRQRLLAAARRLFVTRGYEAATIRDIAAEADLSTGAVFANFTDKADLFNAVIVDDSERLFEKMAQANDTGAVVDSLVSLLSIGYEMHLDQLPLTQAALSFSWVRSPEQEAAHQRVRNMMRGRLGEVLKAAVARGELSSELDTGLTSEMLLDSYIANFRKAIFDGWDLQTLRTRLKTQVAVLLAGYRDAA